VRALVATLALWAAACSPSAGQSDHTSNIALCEDTQLPDDEQIANCTALIASGELNSEDLAEILHTRGFIYMRREQHNDALADFDASIAANPNPERASIYFNRGRSRVSLGDNEGAIADFGRAAEINPQWGDPISWRAGAKSRLGDHAGALADIDLAIRLHPFESEPLNQIRCDILASGGTPGGSDAPCNGSASSPE
jgi:tetratricopeptide (TPR) repeat protein